LLPEARKNFLQSTETKSSQFFGLSVDDNNNNDNVKNNNVNDDDIENKNIDNGLNQESEGIQVIELSQDPNVILAQRAWKKCQSYLQLYELSMNEGFSQIDWEGTGLIGQTLFEAWTKGSVGIARRSGVKERHALWAFLVAASNPKHYPTAPIKMEGNEIQETLLTKQSFQLAVSRLTSLP
jgi:hypothetical protein